MLTISHDDYERLMMALARAGNHVRTLDGMLTDLPNNNRLHGTTLAALTALMGDHVLVDGEVHLVPNNYLARLAPPPKED